MSHKKNAIKMNQILDTVFLNFPHLDLKVVEKINETSFKKTNYVYFFLSLGKEIEGKKHNITFFIVGRTMFKRVERNALCLFRK